MARLARVVAAGLPHHVTQRGNRRQKTFFVRADYAAYIELMATWTRRHDIAIWGYCLMPNHVHLIAVPAMAEGFCRGIGEAHRRYTRRVNFRKGWRGHLWQGRFASFVMDDEHLMAAARYIERNPVRAGLVATAEEWPWSSAAAHIAGQDDRLVVVGPLLERIAGWVCDWRQWLREPDDPPLGDRLRLHERTGRPLGGAGLLQRLEAALGRSLRPGKPGRPKKRQKK